MTAPAGQTLDAVRPAVLIVDDPHAGHCRPWVSAAQRRRVPVVSLHDLGIGRVPSSLAVDGSVVSPSRGWPAASTLRGLGYAVIRRPRRSRRQGGVRRVLVSLGGGPREILSRAVVEAVARRLPDAEVLVTQLPAIPEIAAMRGRVRCISAPDGLAPWLARVDLAIVGGGVSLYEAVAAGVPSVALAIVPAQAPTIRGFARRQLTVPAGLATGAPRIVARRVATRVERLARSSSLRDVVRHDGPRLVDGRGARRVARAVVALSSERAHA
jgi:UDP:flavonoid glycosyltransferase YjiC (YdhE family)